MTSLWQFLVIGYVATVLIETPVLWFGLSRAHSRARRLFAGLWLTACTYPVVVLVFPMCLEGASRAAYLLVAEVFAPVAECGLFWAAFGTRGDRCSWARDAVTITAANLLSFGLGEAWHGISRLAA